MNTYSFRIITEPDDPGGYHGYAPRLKGVHTTGDTVKKNLREAIQCHMDGLLKDNLTG